MDKYGQNVLHEGSGILELHCLGDESVPVKTLHEYMSRYVSSTIDICYTVSGCTIGHNWLSWLSSCRLQNAMVRCTVNRRSIEYVEGIKRHILAEKRDR